jgi:TRAP-type C4-dicarboxylate transport system permease large subunit
VFRGVTPFTVALVALLALVVAFPGLATWLPSFMK